MFTQVRGRALVVGINNYPGAELNCCVNDADEISSILQYPEYGFEVISLLDSSVTRNGLMEELTKLFRDAREERILFYFSGHGFSSRMGTYLLTPDGTEFEPGIDLSLITRLMNVYKKEGRLSVAVLDCCHAGALALRGMRGNEISQEQLRDAGIGLPEASAILAACRSTELCAEDVSIGHGYFTAHVLEGLLGKAANEAGDVTLNGLYDYISRSATVKLKQSFVFKGDFEGYLPLGIGFPPITRMPVDKIQLRKIEEDGQSHLDEYQKQVAPLYSDRRNWSLSGYKSASQLLSPIIKWFERRERESPELMMSTPFKQAYAESRSWQTRLSILDGITEIPWGRIIGKVGVGTFGTVWKVRRDLAGQNMSAFKVFHGQDIFMKEKLARFRRGYEAMQRLDHPQIVKVQELVDCPVGFFMNFIDGPNMRDFVGTLEPADQLSVLLTIAETLAHAHSRGVVHRDVKPENIVMSLIDNKWTPNLTDFDLAWFATASVVTKEAFGSTFYAAPEQINRPSSASARDPRVDVYGFGQLLFYALTGADPVPGSDNIDALRRRVSGWLTGDAAEEICHLYESATKTSPRERIPDCRSVCDSIYKAITLVGGPPDERIEADRFFREVAFGLTGLRSGSSKHISLSGLTHFSFEPRKIGLDNISIRICLDRLDNLAMQGLDSQDARKRMNIRIDEALRSYRNATRHSATGGIYQVNIDVDRLPLDFNGVILCRQIASRAIEAIEHE